MSFVSNLIHKVPFSVAGLGYGYLYNGYAMLDSNFAPAGWSVPTEPQLQTLKTFLASNEGGKLKQVGTATFPNPNVNATDAYGFTALCANFRSELGSWAGPLAKFWTKTTIDATRNWVMNLINTDGILYIGNNYNPSGASVRLIKNDSSDPGTMTDYDGNIYPTITIGTQVWIAKNWKCTKLNNGTSLTKVTDGTTWANLTSEGYCAYNNDDNNV